MMMRVGPVLRPSDSQSDGPGYNCQMQKLVLLSPDRAPAKFLDVAFPARERLLVEAEKTNDGRWT